MLHIDANILWTVFNLLVLLVLLRIFLFKPVLGMIEKRKHMISASLNEAEEKNAAAGALKTQYEDSLKDAKEESVKIVSDAKKRAQAQYLEIIDRANADAAEIRERANEMAESDREKILREAHTELAGMALAAASKLLGTTVDAETNKEMLDAFLAEAGDAE